mgnify:CR=1 FL=1
MKDFLSGLTEMADSLNKFQSAVKAFGVPKNIDFTDFALRERIKKDKVFREKLKVMLAEFEVKDGR